jgi:geranylgeranyl diphosphate synthase type II
LRKRKLSKRLAAMQISKDWILNYDDIEDDSPQRRGKPTLHRLYGKELAINAGDALQVLMWKVLRDNFEIIGSQKTLAIIDEFYRMLKRTTLGQTAEIKWTQENTSNLTDEDIFFILESKTAYYTTAGPMRLGGILVGASSKQLEAIYQFARPLGYCFQIKDDLLDLTSDFKGSKKQQGNDIYERKRTIMLRHLFRTAQGKDQKRLRKIMAKRKEEKTKEEVNWVILIMQKGSLSSGGNLAEKLAKQARRIFQQKLSFLSQQLARRQLQSGIDFILEGDH